MAIGFVNLPDELTIQILRRASTPTFIQLTRTCKKFFDIARQNRKLLLYHLEQLPGEKTKFRDGVLDNRQLFLLLRQRASNVLTGINFTANMHEYLTRDVPILPAASSVGGLDAEYVRMALCFKGTADIRQYTSNCVIKEKIKQISSPGTKVLKLIQWGRFVSVLCSTPVRRGDELSDSSDTDSSDSETEMLNYPPFTPTANARLQRFGKQSKGRNDRLLKILKVEQRYQVIHFDVYTMEDSQIFEIIPPGDMIPRDFAVQDCTICAVLWDKETSGGRPTDDANIVTYTIDSRMEDLVYEQKTVWPKTGKPARNDGESDDEDGPENLPERISFFKDGRRIKLYEAGGVVPYEIFSTSTTQYDQYATTNVISFEGFSVHVDTPFFGTHTTQLDEHNQHSFCFQHHLCLGVATLNLSNGASEDEVKVLCILRSQNRFYPEGCDHRVSLSRMTHISANNSTIAARLWGWEETPSNFSGKNTVAVSPGGTRIAIAMWNKVLVYPLNPKILCDEVVVDSSDEDQPKPKKKKKKIRRSWETACTDYYRRPKDRNLLGWKVAEIRPIVLDLEGAIAHEMSWSPAKGSITDTEEKANTPVQESDVAEDEAVEVGQDGTNEIAVLLAVSSVEPEEDMKFEPESSTNTSHAPIPSPVEFSAIEQPKLGDEESVSDSIVVLDEGQISHKDDHSPSVTIEPAEDLQSGQVSPIEPQSPTQPTKKTEYLQTTGQLDSAAPKSPPAMLSSFSNTFPSSPFSLNHHAPGGVEQPSKMSWRKKEKAPEVNSSEVTGYHNLDKKFQSILSLGSADENAGNEITLSSPLPSVNKIGLKPKQTVAEALAGSISTTTTNTVESVPSNTITAATLLSSEQNSVAATSIPEAKTIPKKHMNQEEESVETSHSKDSLTAGASVCKDQRRTDDKKTKSIKRKQRITEDELIILTDRGIQVWNLGASANGKRTKSYLKLEESLRGKLPRMRQKLKEIVDQAEKED